MQVNSYIPGFGISIYEVSPRAKPANDQEMEQCVKKATIAPATRRTPYLLDQLRREKREALRICKQTTKHAIHRKKEFMAICVRNAFLLNGWGRTLLHHE